MAFIKVGNKVMKCGGKVVTNDLVLLVKLAGDGKTLTVTPTKDISATLARYMLVLAPASGSASEVNIGNTGTYDLSSLHGTVQDGKYNLSVYAVLSSGNTSPFGSIEYYVLAPCNAMTLRFKFGKSGYNPVNAGVGGAGTWNHLIDDVWDWTNTNADWHEAFKGAFTADDNEVEVIGAGDTSGVTKANSLFAGIFSGAYPGTNSYTCTARNNIIECVGFDLHNCAGAGNEYVFTATCLRHANFDFSRHNSTCDLRGFYADTYLEEVGDMTMGPGITNIAYALPDNTYLTKVGTINIMSTSKVDAKVLFAKNRVMTDFGGFIGNTSVIEQYGSTFMGCWELKHIGHVIDITSLTSDGFYGTFNACRVLPEVSIIGSNPSTLTSMYAFMNAARIFKVLPSNINTSGVSNFNNAFSSCYEAETIPDIDVSSATDVGSMFKNDYKMRFGILEMYRKLLARGSAITSHANCFFNCGRDTPEGQAALAQIPTDWGGTMST